MRRRHPSSVCEELELLERAFHIDAAFFIDYTFTSSEQWVSDFCDEYRRRSLRIRWTCETRSDMVDSRMLATMASSGCQGIWFGVESFSSPVVQCAGKYADAALSIAAIEAAARVGIAPHAFIMIGLPGECSHTIADTFNTIGRLRVPYTKSVIVATPRFGTPYFALAEREYPEFDLAEDFFRLSAVRGIVANEMTIPIIQGLVDDMRQRHNFFPRVSRR